MGETEIWKNCVAMTGIITAMLLIIYFACSHTKSKTSAHDSTCISKWHCNLQFGSCFSGERHIPNMSTDEHLPWVLNIVSALPPIFVKHNVLSNPPQA